MQYNKLKSYLRVFKAIPNGWTTGNVIFKDCVLFEEVIGVGNEEVVNLVKELYLNDKGIQATFHKSWEKISQISEEQMLNEQLMHYWTTYGAEELGIVDISPYIPEEKRELLPLEKVFVIGKISHEDVLEKIKSMISGTALSGTTVNDVFNIISDLYEHNYKIDFEDIKNKELKTRLFVRLKKIPNNGEDIIRCMNYEITQNSLLIKDRQRISLWKNRIFGDEYVSFVMNDKEAIEKLAEVFYRYKPLLLSLKNFNGRTSYKQEVNKIRRLSNSLWKPLKDTETFIDKITRVADVVELENDIHKMPWQALVKIHNRLVTLSLKTCEKDVFVIRNQKMFLKDGVQRNEHVKSMYDVVASIIRSELSKRKKHSRVLIPLKDIDLTVPTSEKNFIGMIPVGSRLKKNAKIIGIQWDRNVDIDLSAISEKGKVGWNASHKTDEMFYSGDMTRLNKDGYAAEYVRILKNTRMAVMVNMFNTKSCDYQLIFAKDSHISYGDIINPNNVIYSVKVECNGREEIIGVYDGEEFVFSKFVAGESPVSYNKSMVEDFIDAVRGQYYLKISDIFEIVDDKDEADIILDCKANMLDLFKR